MTYRLILPLICLMASPIANATATGDGPVVTLVTRHAGDTLPERFAAERQAAVDADRHVVVVFTADWCTPCRALKEWLDGDPGVRAATSGGHFVFIDVDTWRGPAHRLIPGAMPRKLPMLARVDGVGALVTKVMGSEIGLLSAEDTARNLKRLIKGLDPEAPSYKGDTARQRALSRDESRRRTEAMADLTQVDATVTLTIPSWPRSLHLLDLVLHNPESRRRWFALPQSTTAPLKEETTIHGRTERRFAEHPRATYHQMDGSAGFVVLPVSSHSTVRLEGWPMWGPRVLNSLEVWAVNTLRLGSDTLQLPPKLPWELHIRRSYRTVAQTQDDAETPARFRIHARHVVSPSRSR